VIRIRSFSNGYPCISLDVTTGSNRVAAQEAAQRATRYGNWNDVSVDFNDGSRPLHGAELANWVARHYPQFLGES
jgi:hypothetical protein